MTHKQRRAARLKAEAAPLGMEIPRPIGPADCFRIRFGGPGQCSKCGGQAAPIHKPTRVYRGLFCAACCPCCAPAASGSRAEPGAVRMAG